MKMTRFSRFSPIQEVYVKSPTFFANMIWFHICDIKTKNPQNFMKLIMRTDFKSLKVKSIKCILEEHILSLR